MQYVSGGRPLHQRYLRDATSVFDREERRRFYRADGCPVDQERLNWEVLYRLEPGLYERLIRGEHIHPRVLEWLPRSSSRVLELGAGTGRLTLPLAARCGELIATEPAAPLMNLLCGKLTAAGIRNVSCRRAFFDSIPVPSASCDLVISCSAFVPDSEIDPDASLKEMERCCVPGGLIVVVWPQDAGWLEQCGYRHVKFAGRMEHEFDSVTEAIELTRIFYPDALEQVRDAESPNVPYDLFRMKAPRDLCWKRVS
jgi:SAM-dependent methyltransferase